MFWSRGCKTRYSHKHMHAGVLYGAKHWLLTVWQILHHWHWDMRQTSCSGLQCEWFLQRGSRRFWHAGLSASLNRRQWQKTYNSTEPSSSSCSFAITDHPSLCHECSLARFEAQLLLYSLSNSLKLAFAKVNFKLYRSWMKRQLLRHHQDFSIWCGRTGSRSNGPPLIGTAQGCTINNLLLKNNSLQSSETSQCSWDLLNSIRQTSSAWSPDDVDDQPEQSNTRSSP